MYVHSLFEVNRREILPLLLLGRHLREQGCRFELEPLKFASNRLFSRPDERSVCLVPFHYTDSNIEFSLGCINWTGQAAIDLCWEQMRNSWNREGLRPKGKMVEAGMIYTAWGRKFEAELLSAGVPRRQIRVTGNMRLDLPHHTNLLLSREFLSKHYKLDSGKPWLLIPWNLHIASGRSSKFLLDTCRKADLPFPELMVDIAQKSRDGFFDLMAKLPDAMPKSEIILRAHPSGDDVAMLRRHVGEKFSRIKVINDLDIMNWLVQSEVVIGWSSTALLEAIAADVPSLCFEPVPYSKPLDYDVGRIAPLVTTVDEVLERVRQSAPLRNGVDHGLFDQWYGKLDGGAHKRVALVCREATEKIDEYCIPSNVGRSRPKISPIRNAARRAILYSPHLSPTLRLLAHGRHYRDRRWLPRPRVEEVMDGAPVERLLRWIT